LGARKGIVGGAANRLAPLDRPRYASLRSRAWRNRFKRRPTWNAWKP